MFACLAIADDAYVLTTLVCLAAPDLSSGATRYRLCGVVNHSGSLHGGHYTADCLNADSQQWYTFNDSRVSPTDTPRGGVSAYVLFFVRTA
jgi:ubiquitin carboxyl-terminal hydrolase 2